MKLTEQQILDIAGINRDSIQKKRTIKESSYDDLETEFGGLGTFVAMTLASFQEQMTDPAYMDPNEAPETAQTVQDYIKSVTTDTLTDIFRSPAYHQLVTEILGQIHQTVSAPDQQTLDV